MFIKYYEQCRLAADQGFPDAQYALGLCYANGLGVVKDDAEAVRLYQLAADQGYLLAKKMLEGNKMIPADNVLYQPPSSWRDASEYTEKQARLAGSDIPKEIVIDGKAVETEDDDSSEVSSLTNDSSDNNKVVKPTNALCHGPFYNNGNHGPFYNNENTAYARHLRAALEVKYGNNFV